MNVYKSFCFFLVLNFIACFEVLSRPEISLKTRTSCTACHVTPWGGGPRTLYGKIYDPPEGKVAATSSSDLFYGDFRLISFYPTRPAYSKSGTTLMQAAGTANVPVYHEDNGFELRVLATYNIATLQSGPREVYTRIKLTQLENPWINEVVIGRFYLPFGLLTDEHRTYTHLQTLSTLNDFSLGGGLSGEPVKEVHYDFVLVNDFQSGGRFTNQDITWGEVFNLRYTFNSLPLAIGTSQNYQYAIKKPQPYAFSIYSILLIDELTRQTIDGSLLAEAVEAKNWNNKINNPNLDIFF